MRKWKLYDEIWQAGAVVTASNTTATKGDDAAQGHVIALWAVWSVNGFTARAAELPYYFLKHVSQRMTNEIREVGAVVYRISDKPPVTIEWGRLVLKLNTKEMELTQSVKPRVPMTITIINIIFGLGIIVVPLVALFMSMFADTQAGANTAAIVAPLGFYYIFIAIAS